MTELRDCGTMIGVGKCQPDSIFFLEKFHRQRNLQSESRLQLMGLQRVEQVPGKTMKR